MDNTKKIDPIDEWLKVENRPIEDRRVIMDFSISCGKTPSQIIAELSNNLPKKFSKQYGDNLLNFSQQEQKRFPSNVVREHVNIVRSFFRFYSLPLKFGVKAHIQFLFK
jgi:hypothetical protein